ncbi:MAG: hypothetical protein K0R88_2194 [Solirubrobacterales bacterium]|nr:hypothetical protein [Solirubrobacterales bacterium]
MTSRVADATRLELRELARRPLLLVLLVALPLFFITRAIATTVPQPRTVPLPGGGEVLSNMQDVHGATMAAITIAFLAGLCGLFIMQSAREADRRLVVAGFRPAEVVVPRLVLIGATTGIVVFVSLVVTALSFTPQQWPPFVAANLLIGLTYASIGAIAGVAFGRLGGTYFMLFLPMIDLGIAQTPMFGDGAPDGWATLLPGYGGGRVLVDASFASSLHVGADLLVGIGWAVVALAAVVVVLTRSIGRPAAARGNG